MYLRAPRAGGRVANMDQWIVHKFGGSSVADASCFRRVADIIESSSNPREAVLQGLAKMRFVAGLGIGQALLPPQMRPSLSALRQLGFQLP